MCQQFQSPNPKPSLIVTNTRDNTTSYPVLFRHLENALMLKLVMIKDKLSGPSVWEVWRTFSIACGSWSRCISAQCPTNNSLLMCVPCSHCPDLCDGREIWAHRRDIWALVGQRQRPLHQVNEAMKAPSGCVRIPHSVIVHVRITNILCLFALSPT
jgi:hypothetical protein